mgnify:CR=1 FL=1
MKALLKWYLDISNSWCCEISTTKGTINITKRDLHRPNMKFTCYNNLRNIGFVNIVRTYGYLNYIQTMIKNKYAGSSVIYMEFDEDAPPSKVKILNGFNVLSENYKV